MPKYLVTQWDKTGLFVELDDAGYKRLTDVKDITGRSGSRGSKNNGALYWIEPSRVRNFESFIELKDDPEISYRRIG